MEFIEFWDPHIPSTFTLQVNYEMTNVLDCVYQWFSSIFASQCELIFSRRILVENVPDYYSG